MIKATGLCVCRVVTNINVVVLGFALILLTGCDEQKDTRNGEGFVDVKGGKIWYRVTGQGTQTPILMLHGGPGTPSHYLNPLSPLGKDRKVITFDQLGCGRSDAITDTTLMTIDNFVDQVNALLTALQIEEVHLYGHSWGTMLGMDYYLKYPEKIKSLILASPCLNADMWENDADSLISTLPDSVQIILYNSIKGMRQDSSVLADAVTVYSNNFYTRKTPVSRDLDSATSTTGWNVYNYMWGSNEFFALGTLKHYDRTPDLPRVSVPVLYTCGDVDSATPKTVGYYQSLTPNSKLVVFKNAGHYTMHDDPEGNVSVVSAFLMSVDK
jgi:proline iminopeptidase